jgi:hypothetical protein
MENTIQGIAAAQVVPVEEQDYIALLKSHDWEYDRADDSRAWRAGSNQRQILNSLQERFDSDYSIWNQHCHRNHRREVPAKAAV